MKKDNSSSIHHLRRLRGKLRKEKIKSVFSPKAKAPRLDVGQLHEIEEEYEHYYGD